MFCGSCGEPVAGEDRFCEACGDLVGGIVGGRFEVRGLVGRGESGVAFLAFDATLERSVLMRELSAGLAGDARRLARLRSVASALAGVADANCVEVYRLDVEAEPPVLFTEYVPGHSVATVMAGGPVDSAGAAAVLDGALRGLSRMHQAGVAHGFVTPSSVLLDQHGRSKVADAGVGLGVQVPTEALMFLAPEVLADPAALPDATADVFTAGALLAALSTGRAPFPCARLDQALRVRQAGPLGLEVMADPIAELVRDATAFDPSDRVGSAQDFRERLCEVAEAELGPTWFAVGTAALATAVAGLGAAAVVSATGATASAVAAGATVTAASSTGAAGGAATGATAAMGSAVSAPSATAVSATTASATSATGSGVMATITAKPLLAAGIALGTAAAAGGTYAAARATDPVVNVQPAGWTRTSVFDDATFTAAIPWACVAPIDHGQDQPPGTLVTRQITTRDGEAAIESEGDASVRRKVTLRVVGALQGRFERDSPTYNVVAYTCETPEADGHSSGRLAAELAAFDDSMRQVETEPTTTEQAIVRLGGEIRFARSQREPALAVRDGEPVLDGTWETSPYTHFHGGVHMTRRASNQLGQEARGDVEVTT